MADCIRADVIVIHGLVLAEDDQGEPYILTDGAVAIVGDAIAAVGKSEALLAAYVADEVLDVEGNIVMPGFIDAHVHTMQTFARGLCDLDHPDRRPLAGAHDPMGNAAVWAQNAWLIDTGLRDEEAAICARLAIAEMLKSGTTTYADVCAFNVDVLATAIGESGIRAVMAKNTSDLRDMAMPLPDQMVRPTQSEIEESLRLHERWNGAFNGRLTVWMGLHALWACSDQLCTGLADAAQQLGTGLSMHLSQTPGEIPYALEHRGGSRPVPHAEALGLFDGRFLAIHSAYLDSGDIDIYARHGVGVVHCPVAAMK
jgi:5-methylthioadenosine/S-adenosylhomocysteine deaminase